MWQDVHEGDDDQDADLDAQLRSPGHASAQSSGDEREAFLRRSGDVVNGAKDVAPTARLVDAPRTSHDSSGPIGVALVTSSKASIASPEQRHIISPEHFAEKPSGSRPSADFIKSLEDPDLGPDEPLLPPPPVNLNISHGSRKSLMPSERSMTPGNDPESALLYTAQRVQVGRSTQSRSSSGTPWASGIGIPSILRRSWLNPKTRSATPTNSSPKSSLIGRQLTDTELEAGRSLSAQLPSEMGYRDASARPLSGVSAMSTGSGRSGNTVFYDAQSREESSPTPPSGPPNPQSTSSNSRSGPSGPSPLSAEPLRASDGEEPPAYEANPSDSRKTDDVVDYLDVPIPRPASPFASVSSVKRLPAPPGLGPPASNLAAASQSDVDDLINIEPSTVYPHEQTVTEQGSLRSMRSHVSPHSVLSASGSAPTSNSASAHSRGFTVNSLKSLAHSSSISSTDRRIVRPNPGEVSPPLSATGRRPAVPPPSHELGKPSPEAFAGAPELAQSTTVTSTATRSSVTTHTSMTDPITGEVVRFSHPSWTGGRDSLEEPDVRQPPSDAWGGSWSSPNHLRVLQNRVAGRENASHA
ncbi:hypothetical protein F5148DRAFT_1331069 [Russula earlei]|uniref:Uncharacterized protein n=1 Tax=Russula earlei TaxID=71964 RepID=A0ACC0TYQ7_9AGAM|nr:hypothetical protein F5148DRAFT_1331069 [Russula earlei]